jgi:hypothetical protein
VQSILPVLLFALGGVLVGGAYSMRAQGGAKVFVILLLVLAVLSVGGGVFWLLPAGTL